MKNSFTLGEDEQQDGALSVSMLGWNSTSGSLPDTGRWCLVSRRQELPTGKGGQLRRCCVK